MPDTREDTLDEDKEQTVMLPMSVLRALLDLVTGSSAIESPPPALEDVTAYEKLLQAREEDLDRMSGMDKIKYGTSDKTIEDLLQTEAYRDFLDKRGVR